MTGKEVPTRLKNYGDDMKGQSNDDCLEYLMDGSMLLHKNRCWKKNVFLCKKNANSCYDWISRMH